MSQMTYKKGTTKSMTVVDYNLKFESGVLDDSFFVERGRLKLINLECVQWIPNTRSACGGHLQLSGLVGIKTRIWKNSISLLQEATCSVCGRPWNVRVRARR